MESAADAPRETIKTPQQAAFFHLKTRFLEILGLSPLLPAFLSLLLSLGFAKKEKKKKKRPPSAQVPPELTQRQEKNCSGGSFSLRAPLKKKRKSRKRVFILEE